MIIADERPGSMASADRSLQVALTAAKTALENRGRDVVVLDMRGLTQIFDYFVIASGASRRQLHAISEEIDHALEDGLGDRRFGIEGYRESRWIVLDYGDVVVHLFDAETRDYYALEQLWSRAKRVPVPGAPPADAPIEPEASVSVLRAELDPSPDTQVTSAGDDAADPS